MNTFVWSQHSTHPHKGAVTASELDLLQRSLDTHFRLLEVQLEEIKARLP